MINPRTSKLKQALFLAIWIGFTLASCTPKKTDTLTIAVAANMQFAMEELVSSFEQSSGIDCQTILGSSGKLTAQIVEGAPFDLFFSANMRYPETLYAENLTLDKPKIYAYGQLVLWSMTDGISPSINALSNTDVDHIALANPTIAPYGKASREILTHYNLWESLNTKFVFGESISQTNQFITSGAAAMGFTAKSVVLSPQIRGQGVWVNLDSTAYTPIAQGAVILKQAGGKSEMAQKFLDFLFTNEGKKILDKFGYSLPE